MSITSKELAALLGISPSAVSIALNGRKGLSEATRKLILDAAETHGVKKPARHSYSSTFINLLIFKKHGMVYGDTPFFSAVTEGISSRVVEAGYKLQVSFFYGNQDYAEQIKNLVISDCAGIVLLATEMENSDVEFFNSIDKPLVMLDSYFEGSLTDSVVINNTQGAYLATKYLLDCGHTELGYIHSNVPINNFIERHEGFRKAIEASEAADRVSITHISIGSTQDSAYNDMCGYLDSVSEMPTAVFADNDIIAISCIRALKEHGYRIPDDVSVVGFDDIPMSYVTSPKLTTVHVTKELLGRNAVSVLLYRIENGGTSVHICNRIGTSLTIRDTVKIK